MICQHSRLGFTSSRQNADRLEAFELYLATQSPYRLHMELTHFNSPFSQLPTRSECAEGKETQNEVRIIGKLTCAFWEKWMLLKGFAVRFRTCEIRRFLTEKLPFDTGKHSILSSAEDTHYAGFLIGLFELTSRQNTFHITRMNSLFFCKSRADDPRSRNTFCARWRKFEIFKEIRERSVDMRWHLLHKGK